MPREASDITLMLHVPRRIAAAARKVVAGLGHRSVVVDNSQRALREIRRHPIEILIFRIERPDRDIRFFEKIKKVRPDCQGIALISPRVKGDFPVFRSRNYPDHLIPDKSPLEVKDLENTLIKVLSGRLFGMEPYGIRPSGRITLAGMRQKSAVISKILAFFRAKGVGASQLRKISLILEEMIMNAVFDAPVDRSGKKIYYSRPRSSDIALKPNERPQIRYGASNQRLAVSVSDPFGRFDKKTFFAHMNRLRTARSIAGRQELGAGMGLFLTFQASDELVINVWKNRRSEFIALLDVAPKKRRRRNRRALHFFQRNAETARGRHL